jgi:hypothetical protein
MLPSKKIQNGGYKIRPQSSRKSLKQILEVTKSILYVTLLYYKPLVQCHMSTHSS